MRQTEAPQHDALAALKIDRSAESHRRGRMRKTRILLGALVLVVASGLGFGLAVRNGWLPTDELFQPPPQVTVAIVEVRTGRSGEAEVVATGYLESRRQAAIGARAPGRIEELYCEEGTRVKKGQILAVLEHADLDASLAAAKALLQQAEAQLAEHGTQLDQDERDLRRAGDLREERAISEDQYEQAKTEFEMSRARRDMLKAAVALAEARVSEAEQQREDMFIRSPFDGTVIDREAEVGESILPGGMGEASGRGSVARIADLEDLEVDTDVKEDFISRVSVGQAAEVTVDAVPDRRYRGRVRTIIPMGDRARATIKVKVKIIDADKRLFPEMSSTVYFLTESSDDTEQNADATPNKVLCPQQAVQEDADGRYVWGIDPEDRVHRINVQTGLSREGQVEIQSGLVGGERVALRPPPKLRAGQQVRVVD